MTESIILCTYYHLPQLWWDMVGCLTGEDGCHLAIFCFPSKSKIIVALPLKLHVYVMIVGSLRITNTNVKFLFKTSHAALIWKRNFTCVFMFPFLFVIRKLPIVTDRTLPSHVLYQYQINSQFHVTQSGIEFRFSGWKTSTLVNTP